MEGSSSLHSQGEWRSPWKQEDPLSYCLRFFLQNMGPMTAIAHFYTEIFRAGHTSVLTLCVENFVET